MLKMKDSDHNSLLKLKVPDYHQNKEIEEKPLIL